MWSVEGARPVEATSFGSFEPKEVLYAFDGPRIFSLSGIDDELYLSYWSDENEDFTRYVVVPTTPKILRKLTNGTISVHDALDQPICRLCDVSHKGEIINCQSVSFDAIPGDALPEVDTMLWPGLEPLITLRAIGSKIKQGQIPSSVLITCVESVQKVCKILSEHVMGKVPQAGRPHEFLRRLFDLPAQRLAFNSFEISFRLPQEQQGTPNPDFSPSEETLQEVGGLLEKGLRWLSEGAASNPAPAENPDENAAILRALKALTPSQGSIEKLEIRGRLIKRRTPFVLDPSARQRVNSALRNLALDSKAVVLEGRIR